MAKSDRYCIVEFNALVLSHVLQLPSGVEIDAAWTALDRPGVVVLRVRGAGAGDRDPAGQLQVAAWSRDDEGNIKWGPPVQVPKVKRRTTKKKARK